MDISRWAMGRGGPDWPVNAEGEKEPAKLVQHTFDNTADADLTISLLAAYGIPCFPYYRGEGVTGKVISGFSGYGAALYVPETVHDEAAAILAARPLDDTDNNNNEEE